MEVAYLPVDMRYPPRFCFSPPLPPLIPVPPPHCYALSSYVTPYRSCIIHSMPIQHNDYRYPSFSNVPKSSPAKHVADGDLIPVRWTPPGHGIIKLNFDGGVSNNKAGCGYVVRDECGSVMLAGCDLVAKASVVEAELSGLLIGLKQVVKRYPSKKKIWIEGDSSIAISFLQRFNPIEMSSWPILQEIKKLIEHFVEVKVFHIYREGNQSADYLAGLGKEKQQPLFWTANYPNQLMRFTHKDTTMVFFRLMKKKFSVFYVQIKRN